MKPALVGKIAALQKPLAAILITRPHPDHYSGRATVLASHPRTAVHATSATMAGIRETDEPKRAYWTPIIGDNYPQQFAYPDITVNDGKTVYIDGIVLNVEDFGPMKRSDDTPISLPQIDAVIVSDLVYNRVHPWLAKRRSALWIAALAKAKAQFGSAKIVYQAHGEAGPSSLVDEQTTYIVRMRGMVAKALQQGSIMTEASQSAVIEKAPAAFPGQVHPLERVTGGPLGLCPGPPVVAYRHLASILDSRTLPHTWW